MIENLVLGSGPVGIAVAKQLVTLGKHVTLVDAGKGLSALRATTRVTSNIDYKSRRQAPSLNGGSHFFWAGACMGYPSNQTISSKIPIRVADGIGAAYEQVFDLLQIKNFDPYQNLPFEAELIKAAELKKAGFDLNFAYVVKDPAMTEARRVLKSSPKCKLIHDAIATEIHHSDDASHVFFSGYEGSEDFVLNAKHVFVCLGAVENTRILLKSNGKSIEGSQFPLGANLTDHISLKLGRVEFVSGGQWKSAVNYSRNKDGSRLWPRWNLRNPDGYPGMSTGFVHFDNFEQKGEALSADVSLFTEIQCFTGRRIGLVADSKSKSQLVEQRIDFSLSDHEYAELLRRKSSVFSAVSQVHGVSPVVEHQLQSKMEICTTNHPSGSHGYSFKSLPNVYPVSAGLFDRAFAINPTVVAMAIGVSAVNSIHATI